MKKFFIFLFFIPCFCYSQESADKEYDGNYAFDRAKEFVIDSIIGSPGIKIKRIYIDGLPGEKYSELTSLYYNGSDKEGIVLGIFDRAVNESGVRYWKYIFLHFNREEAISFFKVVDGIKDRERSYLNDKNKENHVYFKMKDIKSMIIGFLLATCMFLFMGQTNNYGNVIMKGEYGQFSGFTSKESVFMIDTKSADTWIWNSGIKMWEFQDDANVHLINHYDNYRHQEFKTKIYGE